MLQEDVGTHLNYINTYLTQALTKNAWVMIDLTLTLCQAELDIYLAQRVFLLIYNRWISLMFTASNML